ncbi:MAG: hypothetical protein ACM3MF_00820 [Anaerolineae bacterium]
MRTISRQALGTIIFLVGLLTGLALAGAAIWGDFEGMSYFYTGAGYPPFKGLNCPVLMTRGEAARITAQFDNPSDEEIRPFYQVQVSGLAATRNFENQVPVAPHSSTTVDWTVDSNDIDLGRFVMVDMQVLRVAGISTREATCGILVLGIPGLTGSQVLAGLLAISLTGLVLGLAMRERRAETIPGKEMTLRNGMRAAGIAVLLAMLTGLMGSWLIGTVFCAVAVLLLVILLRVAVT